MAKRGPLCRNDIARRTRPSLGRSSSRSFLPGRTPEELADEFEPSNQTIRNWVRQAQLNAGDRNDGLTTAERAEMTRLRKRVKQLEMEREILSKSHGLVRAGKHGAEALFGFVKAYQAKYPIRTMCRVLKVSASGFYAWASRLLSAQAKADALLGNRIEAISCRSRSTYGRPRIHAELVDEGIQVGGKRVARLMRNLHIHGASRRKTTITTIRDRDAKPRRILSNAVSRGPLRISFG